MDDTNITPEIQEIIDKLKTVYDPELPVNIYDLGLIYDIQLTAQKEVAVLMTLTAPNCPVAGIMPIKVENTVRELEWVTDCKVLITFDPPWDKSKLSDAAKLELGLL